MTEKTQKELSWDIYLELKDIEIDAQGIFDSVIEIRELLEKIKERVE